MYDKVMVVFYRYKDEKRITSFYTSRFAEWLRMLKVAKQYEIPLYPRDDDEHIADEIIKEAAGLGFFIEDFDIYFGSADCIQTIRVWVK